MAYPLSNTLALALILGTGLGLIALGCALSTLVGLWLLERAGLLAPGVLL